jgi:pimeloyl-ACP methyl ester carboxylesterase
MTTRTKAEAEAEVEADIAPEIHDVSNGAGWDISLKRVAPTAAPPDGLRPRPVLIVPGYGMNSFIFGFHPRGLSLEAYLASRGLEVWSVDLRNQGRSKRRGGTDDYGLAELGVDDVAVAVKHVLAATKTGQSKLDLIGCSLGTALAFSYLACVPDPPVGSVVNLGGLVTWKKIHPALRAAFYSPRLVGMIKVKHTRKLAGLALPALARFLPKVLSVYMNTASTDTSQGATMIQTVEDPNPNVNREIAEWIGTRELVVRGVNVSRALRSMTYPFLCVIANNDGIVPPETAKDPYDTIGSTDKELLAVGDAERPIAHADLFLSTGAQESVFAVITSFLLART